MTAGNPNTGDLNIFETVLTRVKAACDAYTAAGGMSSGLDYNRIVVEPPRDPSHGDMATNAAMVLAKDVGQPPRKLADAIVDRLRADELIAKAEVAGPGFINISLKPAAWL